MRRITQPATILALIKAAPSEYPPGFATAVVEACVEGWAELWVAADGKLVLKHNEKINPYRKKA